MPNRINQDFSDIPANSDLSDFSDFSDFSDNSDKNAK